MKCETVCRLSSEYVVGDLDARKQSEIRAHLAECESCRAEVAAVDRALSALSAPRAVFDAPDVLAEVKRRAAAQPVGGLRLRPAFAAWAAAGTAALIAVIWLASSWNPTTPAADPPSVVTAPPAQHVPDTGSVGPVAEDVNAGGKTLTADVSGADPAKTPTAPKRKARVRPERPRPTPSDHEQPHPIGHEPKVEYILVYIPDTLDPSETPPESGASIMASSAAIGSLRVAADAGSGGAMPDNSSYSIRRIDNATGEVTTLNVYTETMPGEEPNGVIEYSVTPTEPPPDDDERSSTDDTHPGDIGVSVRVLG